MFHRSTESSSGRDSLLRKNPPTIIAADVNLLGNVISEGTMDIDGRIEGNVRCKSLTIRKNGVIKGDVFADAVHVYGRVEGVIKSKDVHLYASCHVEGVIMHESLTIEDGAFVDGQFKRAGKNAVEPALASSGENDENEVFRRLKLIG
jgi:cytoskeletal protein CcmA (bactofilin family)